MLIWIFATSPIKLHTKIIKEDINIDIINVLYSLLCTYIKKHNYIYMSNFSEYYHTYKVTIV